MNKNQKKLMHSVFFLSTVFIASCSFASSSPGKVSLAVAKEVREKKTGEIDISRLTDFEWSELYLFGPYQDRDHICPALHITGFECYFTIPPIVEEHEYLMVFKKDGEVVHAESHWRSHGDFYGAKNPHPIYRNSALFIVKQTGRTSKEGQPWIQLVYSDSLL